MMNDVMLYVLIVHVVVTSIWMMDYGNMGNVFVLYAGLSSTQRILFLLQVIGEVGTLIIIIRNFATNVMMLMFKM